MENLIPPTNKIRVITDFAIGKTKIAIREGEEYRYIDVHCLGELFSIFDTTTLRITLAPAMYSWLGAKYVVR